MTGKELEEILQLVGLTASDYARLVTALAGKGPRFRWSTINRQIEKQDEHVPPQAAALAALVKFFHEAGQLAQLPAYRGLKLSRSAG